MNWDNCAEEDINTENYCMCEHIKPRDIHQDYVRLFAEDSSNNGVNMKYMSRAS